MCDLFSKIFIECMKKEIKEDKCKKEFEVWDACYKNTHLSEFLRKTPVLEDNLNNYKFRSIFFSDYNI